MGATGLPRPIHLPGGGQGPVRQGNDPLLPLRDVLQREPPSLFLDELRLGDIQRRHGKGDPSNGSAGGLSLHGPPPVTVGDHPQLQPDAAGGLGSRG